MTEEKNYIALVDHVNKYLATLQNPISTGNLDSPVKRLREAISLIVDELYDISTELEAKHTVTSYAHLYNEYLDVSKEFIQYWYLLTGEDLEVLDVQKMMEVPRSMYVSMPTRYMDMNDLTGVTMPIDPEKSFKFNSKGLDMNRNSEVIINVTDGAPNKIIINMVNGQIDIPAK